MNPRLSINYFQCGKKTLDFTNIYNYITACDIFKKLTAKVRFHCGLLFAHFFFKNKIETGEKKCILWGKKSYQEQNVNIR